LLARSFQLHLEFKFREILGLLLCEGQFVLFEVEIDTFNNVILIDGHSLYSVQTFEELTEMLETEILHELVIDPYNDFFFDSLISHLHLPLFDHPFEFFSHVVVYGSLRYVVCDLQGRGGGALLQVLLYIDFEGGFEYSVEDL
jgi:hypothetical protein